MSVLSGGLADHAPVSETSELCAASPEACDADFNRDGLVDFFDSNDFIACFEIGSGGGGPADFSEDGFADFFDQAGFVTAFETAC